MAEWGANEENEKCSAKGCGKRETLWHFGPDGCPKTKATWDAYLKKEEDIINKHIQQQQNRNTIKAELQKVREWKEPSNKKEYIQTYTLTHIDTKRHCLED